MNTGHLWTKEELADILLLTEYQFSEKYPAITADAYRLRRAVEVKKWQTNMAGEAFRGPQTPPTGVFPIPEWKYVADIPVSTPSAAKFVVIGDTHGVFINLEAWTKVLTFIRVWRPSNIFAIGDMIDFYDISSFSKDPNRRVVLGQEIEFTKDVILAELRRAAPNATIVWLKGNHEDRLQRYLWNKAPEMASLPSMDIRSLFSLEKLKIFYIDGDIEHFNLVLTHGHIVRKHSAWTAQAMLNDYGKDLVAGHTHRLGAFYRTDRNGVNVAIENGCLCALDMEYMKGFPNWQLGFSAGYALDFARVQTFPIAINHNDFSFTFERMTY